MDYLGLILIQVAKIIHMVLQLYIYVIIASAILSWIRPDPYNPIVRTLYQLTEPVYKLFRKHLPEAFFRSGIDFTPIIVLFAVYAIDAIAVNLLVEIGMDLRSTGPTQQIIINPEENGAVIPGLDS